MKRFELGLVAASMLITVLTFAGQIFARLSLAEAKGEILQQLQQSDVRNEQRYATRRELEKVSDSVDSLATIVYRGKTRAN